MGNGLARAAVILWPAVALGFFAARRHGASLARTTAWMMLVPAMFLPARFEIELAGLPDLDKHRVAFLSIAVALELFHPTGLRPRLRAHGFARAVLGVLALGAFLTALTNRDPLVYGPTVLPGLTPWDGVSSAAGLFVDVYLPFAIGERVFRTERDVLALLDVLGTCALVYAPLALVEVLLSPQLHRWVYGYYPHMFFQHIRGGGYRPMLFMSHGLSVAMFAFVCLQASIALARVRARTWVEPGPRIAVAAVLLAACKSLGAALYGAAGAALQYLVSERAKARVVAALAVVVLAYPVLRIEGLFPTEAVVAAFRRVSPERAASLAFRFDQEERLLLRANERPIWGWGPWNRPHVFASWGQRVSISDGTWVILLGESGYVGFAGFFALLLAPLARFARVQRRMPPRTQVLVGALALILAVSAVDLLPNSRSDYLSTVYAGALLAVAGRYGRSARRAPGADGPGALAGEAPARAAG
jgi:hypothetical protein